MSISSLVLPVQTSHAIDGALPEVSQHLSSISPFHVRGMPAVLAILSTSAASVGNENAHIQSNDPTNRTHRI